MTYLEIEFPLFLIAVLSNVALAVVVLRYAPKNISRYLFPVFVAAQFSWVVVNYINFRAPESQFLFWARLTMFFATFHAFSFFIFLKSFLAKGRVFTARFLVFWLGLLAITAGLTLSPLVFPRLLKDSSGGFAPQPGPGMPIFGAFVFACVIGAFYSLFRNFRRAERTEKTQLKYLSFGLFLTFVLVLAFSFLNFVFFNNSGTVRLGHLYTLPFVVFTAYAMIRHHLLNTKVIVAELSVFLLTLILFVQLISSRGLAEFFVNASVFVGTLIVGFLLIRGVLKEVEQREKLQVLTKELQEKNDKLVELDRLKSEFLSFASHQVKAPMTVVKGYASLIFDGTYGVVSEKIRETAGRIVESADRMIALVNNLLDMRRIQEGRMDYTFETVEVRELVGSVAEELKTLAEKKKLKFSFSCSIDGAKAKIDKQKFRQVIQNLVDNAIKYTKEGDVGVSLEYKKDDKSRIVISVSDSGIGIPKELLPHLFQQFARGTGAAKAIQGTGLGLYIAKEIMTAHKGDIVAESAGEGKGSVFRVEVPVEEKL